VIWRRQVKAKVEAVALIENYDCVVSCPLPSLPEYRGEEAWHIF
jgi:hypothetical protein